MFARALQIFLHATIVAAAAVAVVIHPTSAQSHPRLEIAISSGTYGPSGGVPVTIAIGCPKTSSIPCESPRFREARTLVMGGRVTAWLHRLAGLEGSIWYGSSRVTDITRYSTPQLVVEGGEGKVVLASVRAVLSIAPIPAMSLLFMAGPAVNRRFGAGWVAWGEPSWFGGMWGVGVDVHPGHAFGFRAALEDYLYRFDSTIPSFIPSKSHHDVVLSLSMGLRLFGRRGTRR